MAPVLKVLRGHADADELAAVSTVLLLLARRADASGPRAAVVRKAGWASARADRHQAGSWRVLS